MIFKVKTKAIKPVAYSLLHSCDGFVGMSSLVVEYISTGSACKAKEKVSVQDLYDVELRTK